MRFYATPAQRGLIFDLIRRAELDPQTVTLLHKPAIEKAGMSFVGWNGEPVARFVGMLTGNQASKYIDALKAQVGDE